MEELPSQMGGVDIYIKRLVLGAGGQVWLTGLDLGPTPLLVGCWEDGGAAQADSEFLGFAGGFS